MSDDTSTERKTSDDSDRDAVSIDHPAAAESEHYAGNLPTDTPVQKQGPNSFDADEAKQWRSPTKD